MESNISQPEQPENRTILVIGDAKVELSWVIIPNMIALMALATENWIGWRLNGIIISFLKKKPPGEQQVMDPIYLILFQGTRICGLISCIYKLLELSFLDTGDVIAKLMMWLHYDMATFVSLVLGLSPCFQFVFLLISKRGFQVSNKIIYWLTLLVLWTGLIVFNSVCTANSFFPPSYYNLRGQEVRYRAFNAIHLISASTVGLSLIIKNFWKKKEPKNEQRSNYKLRWHIAALVLVGVTITLAFDTKANASFITGFFILDLFPCLVIISNDKLHDFVKSKDPELENLVKRIVKVLITYNPVTPSDGLQEINNAGRCKNVGKLFEAKREVSEAPECLKLGLEESSLPQEEFQEYYSRFPLPPTPPSSPTSQLSVESVCVNVPDVFVIVNEHF